MPGAVPLVVGVTGHRHLAPQGIHALRQQVRQVLAQLQAAFPQSPLVILSPLAEGADQLVAEEGLQLGARLLAPLPLPRAVYREDFTDPAVAARFDALCGQARLLELPLAVARAHASVAEPGAARDRQYAEVGLFVARHCHLLLALWDGKPSERTGGTAQIVDYFLTGALPSGFERRSGYRARLHGSGDERLLCHLVCARATPDGGPAAPLLAGQILWRNGESVSAPGAPLPRAFHAVFAHANQFNRDAAQYAGAITANAFAVDDAPPRDGATQVRDPASPAVLYRAADWLAMHFQQRVLLALRILYAVAFLMGTAFTVYDNLPHQDNMIYAFLALFVIGVVISALAKRRDWHRKYLDYRALAEGLRVQCYWRRAGISLTGSASFGQDSLEQKQDIELGWVRNAMRSAGLADDPPPLDPGAEVVAGVIDDWVGDAGRGELGYYRARTRQRESAHHLNETLGLICLGAAS